MTQQKKKKIQKNPQKGTQTKPKTPPHNLFHIQLHASFTLSTQQAGKKNSIILWQLMKQFHICSLILKLWQHQAYKTISRGQLLKTKVTYAKSNRYTIRLKTEITTAVGCFLT